MTLLVALDLSLTATGLFSGDPTDPKIPFTRDEIGTPDRRSGETDTAWNARRYARFTDELLALFRHVRPELLVIEVTSHAHQWVTRGNQRTATTRGHEFRAGLGLGRSLGWIDGLLVLASAFGCAPTRVETIEAKDVKLRIAGAMGAPKAAVKDQLRTLWGWDTSGWRESQVDALAVGLAWTRTQELLAREVRLQALASAQERPVPARKRKTALS